jgi:hypothetical protein
VALLLQIGSGIGRRRQNQEETAARVSSADRYLEVAPLQRTERLAKAWRADALSSLSVLAGCNRQHHPGLP